MESTKPRERLESTEEAEKIQSALMTGFFVALGCHVVLWLGLQAGSGENDRDSEDTTKRKWLFIINKKN